MMNHIAHPSEWLQPEWINFIRKDAFAAEQAGLLQTNQLALIYQQQWFKLLTPKAYGGLELPLPQLIRLEEALSWADGSLGWVVTLCAGAGWFGGFINPKVAHKIFANRMVCLAGSGASTGTATVADGGYLINGSWKYASGVKHATQFTANCRIKNAAGEQVLNSDGTPLILSFVIDAADAKLIPAWKYIGMMGTGSHAFTLENVKVNANRSFKIDAEAAIIQSPLYTYPFLQLAEGTLAANLAGMAMHFVDLCGPIFDEKISQPKLTDAQRKLLTNTLAKVKTHLQSIRDDFYKAVDTSWATPNAAGLQAVSRSSRLLAQAARESVDMLYPYCGLMAASPDTEINQVWRDLHTAGQHALLTFLE